MLVAFFSSHEYRGGIFKFSMEPRNRFQGIDSASLCSLAGRYENPIPTWFLAPIDCSKIPALVEYNYPIISWMAGSGVILREGGIVLAVVPYSLYILPANRKF